MPDLSGPFREYVLREAREEVGKERPLPSFAGFEAEYDLFVADVGGKEFAIVYVKDPRKFTPGYFLRAFHVAAPAFRDSYVVVARALSSYVTVRMRAMGIPFVVPGVQMFWPDLGAIVRRRAAAPLARRAKRLSPLAQLLAISHLSGALEPKKKLSDVAIALECSAMSIGRAAREIEALGLASLRKENRSRFIDWQGPKSAIWNGLKDRMRDPVLRAMKVDEVNLVGLKAIPSGLSALSERTSLASPPTRTLAMGEHEHRAVEEVVEQAPDGAKGAHELEIWLYDPRKTSVDGMVDPFSLWLSLADAGGAKVQAALEEMMEDLWRAA